MTSSCEGGRLDAPPRAMQGRSDLASGGRPSPPRSEAVRDPSGTRGGFDVAPGLLAPLFFANAGAFRSEVRTLVHRRQPAWVVLQCEAITDIDVTAAEILEQLDRELNAEGVHLAFAEMRTRLQDLTCRYGLFDTLDRDHLYPTLDSALAAIEHDDSPEPQEGP